MATISTTVDFSLEEVKAILAKQARLFIDGKNLPERYDPEDDVEMLPSGAAQITIKHFGAASEEEEEELDDTSCSWRVLIREKGSKDAEEHLFGSEDDALEFDPSNLMMKNDRAEIWYYKVPGSGNKGVTYQKYEWLPKLKIWRLVKRQPRG